MLVHFFYTVTVCALMFTLAYLDQLILACVFAAFAGFMERRAVQALEAWRRR